MIAGNKVIDNVLDCGITLASHAPAAMTGSMTPLGVYHNTVSGNVSSGNGTKTGEGAGVGIFASAPGTADYGNVVINNQLTGNGIPGVAIHGHAPGQNLNNNVIVGNQISGNGPDAGDPGPTGIHVSSVVPVTGLVISDNTISGEKVSIAIAAGGEVRIQRNSLGGMLGVDNMGAAAVYADYNWWGCNGNPAYPLSAFAGCAVAAGKVNVSNWLPAAPNQ